MTKEHWLYIDRLKALAMMMVVMGHTIYFCMYHEEQPHDIIFTMICTFHVPLFFFLSGVVIKELPNSKKVLSKSYRFLKPMLIIGFINAIVIDHIRDFFLKGGHNGYWYLLTLTIFYLMLLPFNLNTTKNKLLSILIDIAIALSIWIVFYIATGTDNIIVNAANPWGAFSFWLFFIIGFLVRKYNLLCYLTDFPWLTMLLVGVYFIFILIFFSSLDHLPIFLDFIIAAIAIAALMGIFHRFENTDTWLNRQLLIIGNNTLKIYVFHYFFIRFINIDFLISKNIVQELLFIIPLTIIIVYGSIAIGKLVKFP